MGCFSGRLMSATSDQKLFCKLSLPFCCSFDEFVEEKVIAPSYSSAILTPPPVLLFKHTSFALDLCLVLMIPSLLLSRVSCGRICATP